MNQFGNQQANAIPGYAEEVKEHQRFMAGEARFAKVVKTAEGRKAILVAGQVISVEPQDCAEWLVTALRAPSIEGLTAGVAAVSTETPTSGLFAAGAKTLKSGDDVDRRLSAIEDLLVAINRWEATADPRHPKVRAIDEPAAFARFLATLQKVSA